jgi:hypothetical protein
VQAGSSHKSLPCHPRSHDADPVGRDPLPGLWQRIPHPTVAWKRLEQVGVTKSPPRCLRPAHMFHRGGDLEGVCFARVLPSKQSRPGRSPTAADSSPSACLEMTPAIPSTSSPQAIIPIHPRSRGDPPLAENGNRLSASADNRFPFSALIFFLSCACHAFILVSKPGPEFRPPDHTREKKRRASRPSPLLT